MISSWKEYKDTLIKKLIPPQNDAWGIFTPQGKILVNYSDDKRMIKSGDEDQLFENVEEYGYDFILTSHGGLKGTSKVSLYNTMIVTLFIVSP